jgi:hypothetical protein
MPFIYVFLYLNQIRLYHISGSKAKNIRINEHKKGTRRIKPAGAKEGEY